MTEVVWSDPALQTLERIRTYIAEEQGRPRAAAQMANQLSAAVQSLKVFPKRYAPTPAGHRSMTATLPFIILYDYEESLDRVEVLDIIHAAQNRR